MGCRQYLDEIRGEIPLYDRLQDGCGGVCPGAEVESFTASVACEHRDLAVLVGVRDKTNSDNEGSNR